MSRVKSLKLGIVPNDLGGWLIARMLVWLSLGNVTPEGKGLGPASDEWQVKEHDFKLKSGFQALVFIIFDDSSL